MIRTRHLLVLSPILLLLACEPEPEDSVETATPAPAAEIDDAQNPLLGDWDTPFGAPPFHLIENEHFIPAFESAMEAHNREIEAIASNPEEPTFQNTMVAMELAGSDLQRVSLVFSNLASSVADDEIRAIQREMSPRLAAHSAAIALNPELFARVDALHREQDELGLSAQEARLLEVTHENFVRAGAQLEGSDRDRFAEIRTRLAGLYTQFTQNDVGDSEAWMMRLSEEDLAGLPSSLVSSARRAAEDRGEEGHIIVLSRSLVEPFLQRSPNRAQREEVWRAFYERGNNDNEFNNTELIREILELRLEMANLLGFETFAHFRTAGTMAGTPEAAVELMEEVWWPARARALEEQADIQARIEAAGLDHEVAGWDWRFFTEQVREERFDLDDGEVSAFLELDRLIDAQFYVAERLFDVRFVERDDVPVYHPDVRVWEMVDADGSHMGLFYGDFFARSGKRAGAWMSSFRVQNGLTGATPLILNNSNFNKPSDGEPALISFTDATTLFHEFGHGLHGLLSNTQFPSLAGTSVDRDFVEFPAQILEHWLAQPQILERFATHHETGEPMPMELLERVLAARTFNQGFATVEFLNSGFVDMAFHLETDPSALDVEAFEARVLASRENLDAIPMRHRSTHFLHSFAGEGYAAGYYSYLWAGVLDNDGFAAFTEAGDIFDPDLARSLRENVFAAGNTIPAMEAFVAFRGREPAVEPLLRSRGFGDLIP